MQTVIALAAIYAQLSTWDTPLPILVVNISASVGARGRLAALREERKLQKQRRLANVMTM